MSNPLTIPIEVIGMEVVPTNLGFEDFYRDTFPTLFAVATALTGDRHDSEDLVQDTMVKAYLRWPRVGLLDHPAAWCHRVLTNACRSRWRRGQTRARYIARHRHSLTVDDALTADVIAFWSVVRTMPDRPRMVVALYYAAERSTVEIAATLNVPIGTVRSDLTRARAILVERLGA
jgi:RNA polymerase sigma factor (sigma-70 family)